MTISFDVHDTILVIRVGGKLGRIKFFRAILYFLSSFRPFIFTYTLFCKRNENVINEMIRLKQEGHKIIILTSTYKKCKKVILYFLNKNKITDLFDVIIFREKFSEKEVDFKSQEVIKENIDIHYDDGIDVYNAINKIEGKKCILVKK